MILKWAPIFGYNGIKNVSELETDSFSKLVSKWLFPTKCRCFQLQKECFGPETGWIDQMRNNTQYDIKTVVTTSGDQELWVIDMSHQNITKVNSIPEPCKGYSNWFRKIVNLRFQVKGHVMITWFKLKFKGSWQPNYNQNAWAGQMCVGWPLAESRCDVLK